MNHEQVLREEELMNNELPTNQGADPKKPGRSSGSLWFPIMLIVVGFIFLIQEIGDFRFDNWWAIFILIPAFSAFGSAYAIWNRTGRLWS